MEFNIGVGVANAWNRDFVSGITFGGGVANAWNGGCSTDALVQGLHACILQVAEGGAEAGVPIPLHHQLHCKCWGASPGLVINLGAVVTTRLHRHGQ